MTFLRNVLVGLIAVALGALTGGAILFGVGYAVNGIIGDASISTSMTMYRGFFTMIMVGLITYICYYTGEEILRNRGR